MNNFFNHINTFKSNVAVITEQGNQVKYEDLIKSADLIGSKVNSRNLVFCISRNCIESIVGYVGFLRNNIVQALINIDIGDSAFDDLLESYRPQFVYLPSHKSDIISKGSIIDQYGEYSLIKTEYEKDYVINEDLALLLTTSGSTGSPKFVRQSYSNLISNTESIIEYLKIVQTDRAITTLPMSYTYGLSILNTHLYAGGSVVLTDKTLMDKKFWTLLKDQEANNFGGVPYIYEILKKLSFDQMDLPSLRYITQAGGKLSRELSADFSTVCQQKGIQMIVMYGQTEATARMSYLPWNYAISKAGSIGIAIPGGAFWLADLEGKPINNVDTMGELVYQGGNVTLGYAESRFDLSKDDENNGILYTGDMAKVDADGFYYIVGRKKRFLKLFGSRVNLDEVEGMLKKEEFDCVCSGEDDQMKIYITQAEKVEDVRKYILQNTSINHAGFYIIVIDQIPRNESGKVLYSELK
jgi:acyl-CoA synthetase (AMP-forming)/AMP-acid ligase II